MCVVICIHVYTYMYVSFFSAGNAAQLLYVSILYYFHIGQKDNYHGLFPVDVLYIIVGLEALITLPCLAYYIGKLPYVC